MKGVIPIFILMLSCLFPGDIRAQTGEVTFTVSSDARQVVLGNQFEVSFTIKNGQPKSFEPPDFKGFRVVGGPNQSTQVSSVNGAWSRKISYSYYLRPTKVGKFTIDVARIRVDGKVYKTKPFKVEVVKSRNSSASNTEELNAELSEDIFILAVPSDSSAFVGQQIILDYKLFTTRNIETYNLLYESDYTGFFTQDIRRFSNRVLQEVVNGKQYSTKILKRVALFPQQNGTLEIEPMEMDLAVLAENQPRRRSFFYTPKVNRISVKTKPLSIQVHPLPANAPPSFSGAVGLFRMGGSVNKKQLSTDDALSLKLTISGTGDIKRVQPPTIVLPPNFELYDPKVLEEQTNETVNGLRGTKIIEYLMLPKQPGNYQLQPEFTYFATDSSKYQTISLQPIDLNITQGKNTAALLPNANESTATTLQPFIPQPDIYKKSAPFFGSKPFWALTGTPFLAFLGLFIRKRVQDNKTPTDPLLLKRQRAEQVAQHRLTEAKTYLDTNSPKEFYDAVSRALFGYISDKLEIPFSRLSKNNIRQKLIELNVYPEHIEHFMGIVETCEMALFAGKDNAGAMADTYEKAKGNLQEMEQDLT